jgi:hypothetical protein
VNSLPAAFFNQSVQEDFPFVIYHFSFSIGEKNCANLFSVSLLCLLLFGLPGKRAKRPPSLLLWFGGERRRCLDLFPMQNDKMINDKWKIFVSPDSVQPHS